MSDTQGSLRKLEELSNKFRKEERNETNVFNNSDKDKPVRVDVGKENAPIIRTTHRSTFWFKHLL